LGRIIPRIVPHVSRTNAFFRIELEVLKFRMIDVDVDADVVVIVALGRSRLVSELGAVGLEQRLLVVLEVDELSEECEVSSVIFAGDGCSVVYSLARRGVVS